MFQLLVLAIALPAALGAITGAPVDAKIDASDPSVLFAVSAINDYYAKQGDNGIRTLTKVVKAQTQVVAGTLYHLTLAVSSGGQDEICEVSVWSQPWLSGDDATRVTQDPACKPLQTVTKPPLMGGEHSIDINSAEVQNALDFGVKALNAQENYLFQRKAVKVEKVTAQVVSGMAYHFYNVHMAATDCTKSDTTLLENCNVANGADTRMCSFDIWWQSWMTPEYKLTNMKCQ